MPQVEPGPHPAANGHHPAPPWPDTLTAATLNVENLYDLVDDPDDNCDANSDAGTERISRPFNYLPSSEEFYQAKLTALANQVVNGLEGPDLLLLQEIEDQDLFNWKEDSQQAGSDGIIDGLQALASAVRDAGGPEYYPAADRSGVGHRGIICGFLYRPDRLILPPPTVDHPVLGNAPTFFYRGKSSPYNTDIENPKALNALLPEDVDLSTGMAGPHVFPRAVQVGWFQLRGPDHDGPHQNLYVLNNHFCSRPHQRVAQRREEALFNRRLVETLQNNGPASWIIVGGDLNVYPRPDDPFVKEPSDQLAHLYDAGLINLHDELLRVSPENAYTYVYQGQAGTLDQFFVSPNMHQRLHTVWIGHFNSDWPDEVTGTGMYGASDHDPLIASFRIE